MFGRHVCAAVLAAVIYLTVTSAPINAEAGETHRIEIINFQFAPASLQARVGDQIIFVNKDVVPHTATEASLLWNSHKLGAGVSWTLKAEAAGSTYYFCEFHPSMKAEIIVQ